MTFEILEIKLENAGKECWRKCGKKQGPCLWCGTEGMCCKQDKKWIGDGCDGTFGGKTMHTCSIKIR